MLDPSWVTAGADLAIAAENGVMMIGKRKIKDNDPGRPPEPVMVVQPGVTSHQVVIVSAVIVALAMLLAAGVIHHGLTA